MEHSWNRWNCPKCLEYADMIVSGKTYNEWLNEQIINILAEGKQ